MMNRQLFPSLCSPIKIGSLTLRNRMASAPTSLATLAEGSSHGRKHRLL